MYVVSYANSLLVFTEFGRQKPRSIPKSTQNPLKIDPRVSRMPLEVPSAPQERQESTKEAPWSAPRALQERPGAPPERPEEPQEPPKSGPERPKVSPRWLREPIQERSQDFAEIAFSSTRERDSEGSRRPRERPRSSQIASRSLSRVTLGEKSRSTKPVERKVERLGAARSLGEPVGMPVGQPGRPTGFAHPTSIVG